PAGPHGSSFSPLLKLNYSTTDFTQESSQAYALCYSCHDRNSILGDQSFRKHKKHIESKDTPCSVCHDPHGISSATGATYNNTHLINFDLSVVFPDPNTGKLEFVDTLGVGRGECYLQCHGKKHSPKRY
ncbi:MAG: cytochrome C, partial [Candidatus Zixiibacteriota bacterium]